MGPEWITLWAALKAGARQASPGRTHPLLSGKSMIAGIFAVMKSVRTLTTMMMTFCLHYLTRVVIKACSDGVSDSNKPVARGLTL